MSSSRCCCCCFPDRISEQHAAKSDISTMRKTRLFVCVCVCVFALLRLFARTSLCCFSSFFRFFDLYYKMSCLLLVRQSRRFEQTKRKNTLTTRGSANICLRAPYHGAFKFHSYKTRFSFGNENRRARARARESLKKNRKSSFPDARIIVDPVIRVFVLSFATLCVLCIKLVAPH